MNLDALNKIASALVANGKGILAADESTGTIGKRFDSINTQNTEDNRRAYREMLFRSTDAMTNYISGVILFDETIRQNATDGTFFVEIMKAAGCIPGIKVDKGAVALAGCAGETITEGLDGLRGRLKEYSDLGAQFAKWRGVIEINDTLPSQTAIAVNAQALARYAALCQEAGIVPIVEPEILMDGANSIERCKEVTEATLIAVFAELKLQRVALEGIVLKPNMVIAGKKCTVQASREQVAEHTVQVLKKLVPAAVPGIAFLSGGQSDEDATAHLSLMNEIGGLPWALTYSYGRALQAAALKAWGGKTENVAAGQRAFTHRAKMNSLAATGKWTQGLEQAA